MYLDGKGGVQHDEEAVKWFRKAAEKGDFWAQDNLGRMYKDGRGVVQDDQEAVKWFRNAAEHSKSIISRALFSGSMQVSNVGNHPKQWQSAVIQS